MAKTKKALIRYTVSAQRFRICKNMVSHDAAHFESLSYFATEKARVSVYDITEYQIYIA